MVRTSASFLRPPPPPPPPGTDAPLSRNPQSRASCAYRSSGPRPSAPLRRSAPPPASYRPQATPTPRPPVRRSPAPQEPRTASSAPTIAHPERIPPPRMVAGRPCRPNPTRLPKTRLRPPHARRAPGIRGGRTGHGCRARAPLTTCVPGASHSRAPNSPRLPKARAPRYTRAGRPSAPTPAVRHRPAPVPQPGLLEPVGSLNFLNFAATGQRPHRTPSAFTPRRSASPGAAGEGRSSAADPASGPPTPSWKPRHHRRGPLEPFPKCRVAERRRRRSWSAAARLNVEAKRGVGNDSNAACKPPPDRGHRHSGNGFRSFGNASPTLRERHGRHFKNVRSILRERTRIADSRVSRVRIGRGSAANLLN